MISILIVSVGWIVALCLHEFGHALVAYIGGDSSVKEKGYLTLNPLKYTDASLSLAVPLIFLMLGGVALPGAAVYIDRTRLRNRFWHSAVSAAGPLFSTIVLLLFCSPFLLGYAHVTEDNLPVWSSVALLVLFQAIGIILNSLPIPPLDGWGVIEPWLPAGLRQIGHKYGTLGMGILFALLWFVRPLNEMIWGVAMGVTAELGVSPVLISQGYRLFKEQSIYLVLAIILVLIIGRKNQPADKKR